MTGMEPRHRALRSSSLFRQKRNDPVDKNGDGRCERQHSSRLQHELPISQIRYL